MEYIDETTWRFEYSSATIEGQEGVGLLISPKLTTYLSSTDKISDRILVASFRGNPSITIIVAYAPTEDKCESVKKPFYEDLKRITDSIPPHNVIILAGDLNARVGADSSITNPRTVGRYPYHEETNGNGEMLINYCESSNMRSMQTRFRHPKSRTWTWRHATGTKAQLDLILINGKWLNKECTSIQYSRAQIRTPNSNSVFSN